MIQFLLITALASFIILLITTVYENKYKKRHNPTAPNMAPHFRIRPIRMDKHEGVSDPPYCANCYLPHEKHSRTTAECLATVRQIIGSKSVESPVENQPVSQI